MSDEVDRYLFSNSLEEARQQAERDNFHTVWLESLINSQRDKFGLKELPVKREPMTKRNPMETKAATRSAFSKNGKKAPIFDFDGFNDRDTALLKRRMNGEDWGGGIIPLSVKKIKEVLQKGLETGCLRYDEYKLFPVPERFRNGNKNQNSKEMNMKKKTEELDELKKTKGRKATVASKNGKKNGVGGKGFRAAAGLPFKPGTTREAIYKAIADGKLHKLDDLKLKFPKASVRTEVGHIHERGAKLKLWTVNVKNDQVQLVKSK